ncbi:unnamed protein product [Nezara viridula]|uniref:Uncharacterized protein n=1 Tax=Nezara viridula TaxID=85310 RepID=A0A9P0HTZ8_NEZVI|nr:unnamed protein product [Nezara viridula]
MDLIKRVYLKATNCSRSRELTKDDFQYHAHKESHITPMKVDILFKLCKLNNKRGEVAFNELQPISTDDLQTMLRPVLLSNEKKDEDECRNPFWFWKGESKQKQPETEVVNLASQPEHHERSNLMSVLESLYRLTMGFTAGATGAAAVYPIDLVKTRMQNQRINPNTGERMYNHSFDCFYKVIKYEGIRGLYRGLLPQVCGVAPEKATKLTVNDFIRDHLKHEDGYIPLWAEIVAGASGGFSQVTFSNPVEIIKIQLQVAGEVKGGQRPSALAVFKEKFFFGLYKGASACYCRDMTFAGIYFPTYANTKILLTDDSGYNNVSTLFLSGLIAGVPAASIATPFDVVKTRLQVKPRPGQTTYSGLRDAFKKVWREEGWTAFWKGAGARVCRSSPQFAVTLVTYELLQRLFYFDFGGRRPEGSEKKNAEPKKVSYNPNHNRGYEEAIPMITGIETQFGINLPKFNIVTISPSEKKTNEPEE